jgi:hypothetical protein
MCDLKDRAPVPGHLASNGADLAMDAPVTTTGEQANRDLARRFHQHVLADVAYLKSHGYNPARFIALVSQTGGAVAAVKQLLADPRHTFDGFERLWEMGELARSVEFAANLPWFQPLFTDQELQAGRSRLALHDFPFEARIAAAATEPPVWTKTT